MQSDVRGPKQQSREIIGLKGLYTMAEDSRTIPDGYCQVANDVVFDKNGNVRPKDGSATWWPSISQRTYLAEFVPTETWTNGAEDYVNYQFGYSSRSVASTAVDMSVVFPASIDIEVSGRYAAAVTTVNIWVYAATPSDVTGVVLQLSSGADFSSSAYTLSADITTSVTALTAATWTLVQVPLQSFTGAANTSALKRATINVTCTAGDKINFDEWYVSYTDYSFSFPTGMLEFNRISDGSRFLIAGFGETIYADLNEACAPYKVLSQITRNAPLSIDIAEDRCFFVNGFDSGFCWTGQTVRKIGLPAPPGTWVPGYTYAGSSSPFNVADAYNYGVTFVYGEDGVEFGQSSMLVANATTSVTLANNEISLANIPLGAPGSGVIARRLFRNRQGAGPLATMYMLTELSDNTTTTYTDQAADTAIVTAEQGPIDNGMPPISKQVVWFQKGMVYVTEDTVMWSRVGVDINSDVEIVPGENVLAYGASGTLSGAVEFNGNLYLFSKRGITALYWQGTALYDRPVQRTSDNRAQNVGAYDGRSVTVVQNRYMRWQDSYGQVWRMWPNEQIEQESLHVANVLDDFNRYPIANSTEIWTAQGQEAFNGGTMGANLTADENAGVLQYKDATMQQTTGDSYDTPPITPLKRGPNNYTTPNLNFYAPDQSETGWSGPGDVKYFVIRPYQSASQIAAGSQIGVVSITALEFYIGAIATAAGDNNGVGSVNFNWTLYQPNYSTDYQAAQILGAVLETGTCTGYIHTVGGESIIGGNIVMLNFVPYPVPVTLSFPVYVPMGEWLILGVELASGGGTGASIPTLYAPTNWVGTGPYYQNNQTWVYIPTYYPNIGNISQYIGDINATFSPANDVSASALGTGKWTTVMNITDGSVYYSGTLPDIIATPAGLSVQRWWKYSSINAATDYLRGAQSVTITGTAQDSTGAYVVTAPLYSRTFITASDTNEPVSSPQWKLWPTPDWRPGGSSPPLEFASTFTLSINFTFFANPPTPTELGQSGITIVTGTPGLVAAVPSLEDVEMTFSYESSFTSPYDMANYTNDMWTSWPVSMPNGAISFGKLSCNFAQNQEQLFFQLRTADNTTDLATATWYDIPPNVVLTDDYTPADSDRFFQLRIIFQDIPAQQSGIPSTVSYISLSWTSQEDDIYPILPPVMYYYRDYTYMSWPSTGARLADRSLAVDDFADTGMSQYTQSGQLTNRWSAFTLVHYTCYAQSNGDLIGGPVSGGQLVKLRQSAVTEFTQSFIPGLVTLWPTSCGTPYLKTFSWFYMGFALNQYLHGLFSAQATAWPPPASGFTGYPVFTYSLYGDDSRGPSILHGLDSGSQYFSTEPSFVGAQSAASGATPFQPEYGYDVIIQERAVGFTILLYPFLDTAGDAWFPMFTNLGLEWFTENYRGV